MSELHNARPAERRADQANTMARLVVDRLNLVNPFWLRRLKKRLSQFNSTTGQWNSIDNQA